MGKRERRVRKMMNSDLGERKWVREREKNVFCNSVQTGPELK